MESGRSTCKLNLPVVRLSTGLSLFNDTTDVLQSDVLLPIASCDD